MQKEEGKRTVKNKNLIKKNEVEIEPTKMRRITDKALNRYTREKRNRSR